MKPGIARAVPGALFSCAGLVDHGAILDATDDDFDFAIDLNARSVIRTIRAALPDMLERGTAPIINMPSAAGSIIGAPNRFVYGTTKADIVGLTKSVAADYLTKGIRCICSCIGKVESSSCHDRVTALGEQSGIYD